MNVKETRDACLIEYRPVETSEIGHILGKGVQIEAGNVKRPIDPLRLLSGKAPIFSGRSRLRVRQIDRSAPSLKGRHLKSTLCDAEDVGPAFLGFGVELQGETVFEQCLKHRPA